MATFVYVGRDAEGQAIRGAIDGDTEIAVITRLQGMGYAVTGLRRRAARPTVEDLLARFRGVRLKELSVLTRQLATMINAGLTVVQGLVILEAQSMNRKLVEVIAAVRRDVEAGTPLSEALKNHPRVFSDLFVNMVKAGETGGVLDDILARLAALLEKELALRQKIKAAMIYPAVIGVSAVGIVTFIVFFILPQFVAFFAQLNVPLPLPTLFLIAVTRITSHFWWLLLLLAGLGTWGARYHISTSIGRAQFDYLKLRMPLLGPVNRNVVMSRFARTLSALMHSGVPILVALDVVSRAVSNSVITQALHALRESIREGESMAAPLQASGVFPPMVVQMVSVGERTGELDAMLAKIADFYDTEVEFAVAGLTSILEPLLIIVMGSVVGFIVIAFYLPLFNMIGAIK